MKKTKYPNLRTHVRRGKNGQVWTYWTYDRRSEENKEPPRKVEVTDAMFAAVYEQADRVLRDAMDIATSTGMRVTDVRTVATFRRKND